MDRKRNVWNVTLQREDGDVVTHQLKAYWDPSQEGCNEAVAASACAEAYWASHKKFHFAPISVALAV